MGGHGPAVKLGKDNASGYKGALGIKLFIVYTIIYAIFVAINVIDPSIMDTLVGGQNIAVIYGLFLIALAFVMALVYNSLCNKAEARMNK